MHRRLAAVTAVGALAACLALAGPFAATAWSTPPAAGWTSVDLGSLGGARTEAVDVNERGQVVGRSQTADGTFHAFLWEKGVMTDLTPDGPASLAFAINDRGTVTGWLLPEGDQPVRAVRWHRGTTTVLADDAFGLEVNESGQVGGVLEHADGSSSPFVWSSGSLVDVGPTPYAGALSSTLVDLNRSGTVLGLSDQWEDHELSYVWTDGTFARVGGDDGRMVGEDLSDRGHVAGRTWDAGATLHSPTAALWRGGAVEPLGVLPGDVFSAAVALNEQDVVVGSSWPDDDTLDGRRGFVWADGTLEPVEPAPGGWSEAWAVNDSGQVAGRTGRALADGRPVQQAYAWRDGTLTPLGTEHTTIGVVDQTAKGHVLTTAYESETTHAVLHTPPKRRS